MNSRRLAIPIVTLLALTGSACGSSDKSDKKAGSDGKVSISVGCQPAKSQPAQRKEWNADVAAFQKLHPNITIVSKDAFPCSDPKTFTAKLAGGQMEDVFYVYFTDVRNVINTGQAADITKYVGDLKQFGDIQPSVENVFKGPGGKVYGVPRQNYSMGLLINRKLFQQAGLNPDTPPATWDEVRADAKKIAGLGKGVVGYADYSAGNQGGWHFTTELYGQGGDVVTPDGKKAAFNSPQGKAVLSNLQQMRWTDNSMGSKQLLRDADVQQMMAAGKLGMYLSAPDNVTALVDQFHGQYKDYGLGPLPGAQASLLGGDGYMINVKASPAKIKAAMQWLEYQNMTPGQGQFDYARQAVDKRPVGIPQPNFYTGATGTTDRQLRAKSANIPVANFKAYEDANVTGKLEPPQAQQIYATLDTVMSAVLTKQNANLDQLLADAAKKVDAILARGN